MTNRTSDYSNTASNTAPAALSIETVNIVCIDANYKYLFFNQVHKDAVKQAWGTDVNMGTNLLEIIPDDADRIAIKKNLDMALDGKTTVETSAYGEHEKRLWESMYSPMYDTQGDVIGINVHSLDVTEHKKADFDNQEKSKKINYLFENMTEAFALGEIICDENNEPCDYQIIEINKAFEQQCGVNASEILSKTVLELFPDVEKSWIQIYGEVALTGKPNSFVNFNHNTQRHYETTAFSPKKGQFAMLFRDIEESKQRFKTLEQEIIKRKKAQKIMKKSESMFRALFEQTGGYCMILQPTESGIPIIVDVNQAACDEHGYLQSEMIGQPIIKFIKETEQMIKKRVKSIMSGKTLMIEATHIRKDGSTFPVSVCANLILMGKEQPLIFSVEHNISAIKIAEAERKQAESISREHLAQLAHVSRLETMGEMATGIAHEITQPLTAISVFACAGLKLIQKGNQTPELLIEAFEGINTQSIRAGNIIQQLRKYVQKESTQKVTADLNSLIRKVIYLMEPELKDQGIDLHLMLAAQLPPVTVNDIEIQQVLVNLLRNAAEAMRLCPVDLRKLTITNNLTEPSTITVTISDTGSGMDKDTQEHIFEPFFTTKGNNGIGVGLSISHALIKSHGGTLTTLSQLGRGSSFSFTLPIKAVKLEE